MNTPSLRLSRGTALLLCLLATVAFTQRIVAAEPAKVADEIAGIRTTAYTHSESDHLVYGRKNALGTQLRYGSVRSAAADWSVFPVGTRFTIGTDPQLYEVDDYGSALVGKSTIDLYKPSHAAMNSWGTRRVTIHVIQWGSYSRSLALLKERLGSARHIRPMYARLLASVKPTPTPPVPSATFVAAAPRAERFVASTRRSVF